MLLPVPHTLREHLLTIFARTPQLEAGQLLKELQRRGVRVTKQGVYKELRHLVDASVIVKHGRGYALSIPWILSFSEFADCMFDTYIGQSNLHILLPDNRDRDQWTFRNLAQLNDFWVELVFTLLKEQPREILYNWLPYPWFVLLQSVRSQTWAIAMRNTGMRIRTILGSDTPLVREYVRRQGDQIPTEEISLATSPFHGTEATYYESIGDWLITVSLAPTVAAQIQQYFSSSQMKFSGAWFESAAAELRAERKPCKIKVERNTASSRKVSRLFREYWGDLVTRKAEP